jgi:hypothetical protein
VKRQPIRGFFDRFGIALPLLAFIISVLTVAGSAFGGAFVYFKWWVQERPTYEARASVNSTLDVRPSSYSNQCEAIFTVDLENQGVSPFDINQTQVRVWAFDSRVIDANKKATYVGLDQMQSGTPLFDSEKPELKSGFETIDIPFVRHYAIGEKFFRTFKWFIRREPNSNFYFRVDFKRDPKSEKSDWFTAAWAPSCTDASPTQPNAISTPTPAK